MGLYITEMSNFTGVSVEQELERLGASEKIALDTTARVHTIEELARKSASGETSDNVLGTDIIK